MRLSSLKNVRIWHVCVVICLHSKTESWKSFHICGLSCRRLQLFKSGSISTETGNRQVRVKLAKQPNLSDATTKNRQKVFPRRNQMVSIPRLKSRISKVCNGQHFPSCTLALSHIADQLTEHTWSRGSATTEKLAGARVQRVASSQKWRSPAERTFVAWIFTWRTTLSH